MSEPTGPEGNGARSPFAMPFAAWKRVLMRTWTQAGEDNIGLIAAGTAFYAFAAIVPLLGAIVLTYGLVAAPETVNANIRALFEVLPADAARLIGEQLGTVVESSGGKTGFALAIALGIALYGATKGASSIVTALNIAYEEHETRGFVTLNILALALTVGAVALVLVAIASTTLLAFLGSLIPNAPGIVLTLIRIGGYVVMAALVVTAAALLYRFGPARKKPTWIWLSPGAGAATVLWLAGTAGFGLYVANFGNYGATYGSLSAVIVLLTWLWLSAYVFLLGAELNGELERQARGEPVAPSGDRPTLGNTPPAPVPAPGALATATRLRIGSTVTRARLGTGSTLLAGAGLAALRRGRGVGIALIAAGAALAWAARPDAKDG